ncbi:MAG TPA: citramalate synthase, partial [Clostridia bacterium]
PKDLEFFERVKSMSLSHSRLIAFGSTRRVNTSAEDDSNVQSLLKAGTPAVALFGKSWDFHVTDILKTTLDENLKMIYDTVSFFKKQEKEVVYDAELFFEGYRSNPEYAIKTLEAAVNAGADTLVLCETTGGSLPSEIQAVTSFVVNRFNIPVGIHCHNDSGMAIANSIVAVEAGATHVQGTINGFGERCGNANLCAIIPNLQIKLGLNCLPGDCLEELTALSRYVNEIANTVPDERAPYVGRYSFAHKAGMHSDAVSKNPASYEHINPETVGNERVFLMSEVAGRSAVLNVIKNVDKSIKKDSREAKIILERLKELEHEGYQYEGAESSFELEVRKLLGKYKSSFELKEFKVIVNEPALNGINSSAMIKIKVDNDEEITAADGDGPVNALDKALRKALERFYPEIRRIKLTDYKVRVLDSQSATASKVRVLIESTNGRDVWTTIGVSADIIDASWKALVDSIEYMLIKYGVL